MKKKFIYIGMLALAPLFSSCADYLDVVPEGTATIEMAFHMRSEAIKYLATCYSYMPSHGNPTWDPALLGGDELCGQTESGRIDKDYALSLSRGGQSTANPLLDKWSDYYKALRDCNIFLENVASVPDLPAWERDLWIAEVKVLKAFYHFQLVQMYGPVPIIRENLSVDAGVDEVKVTRDPIDECFAYIEELLDEAINMRALPLQVYAPADELGRITLPIAHMIRAKVLTTAASPLYNGNHDQATLRNHDGTQLFSQTEDKQKWVKAANACKAAVDVCKEADIKLYQYTDGASTMDPRYRQQMTLRRMFNERWNSEIIWANTNSRAGGGNTGLQQISTAKLNSDYKDAPEIRSLVGVALKMAEIFYSNNGVPITEDKDWAYASKYELRDIPRNDDNYTFYLEGGEVTARLNMDREPRFYAFLGFDRGAWHGQGKKETEQPFFVHARKGDTDGQMSEAIGMGPLTGYWAKKLVYDGNALTAVNQYSCTEYPWPIYRLADLYLLYAEAINEAYGPEGGLIGEENAVSENPFTYIDAVRERAGLKGVKESWSNYSNSPTKYTTQTGLRAIIQQERMIELAFEGIRFWDIRRWKIAPSQYQTPMQGWDMSQSRANYYYRSTVVYKQSFGVKDYFWPISNDNILKNDNLVQNIGW